MSEPKSEPTTTVNGIRCTTENPEREGDLGACLSPPIYHQPLIYRFHNNVRSILQGLLRSATSTQARAPSLTGGRQLPSLYPGCNRDRGGGGKQTLTGDEDYRGGK